MTDTAAGRMADDIRAPIDTTNGSTGADGVFVAALNTTAQRYIVPSAWRGKYVDVQCDGGTGFVILFGGSGVVAAKATVSTVTAEAIEFEAGSAWKIEAGTRESQRIPVSELATHFSVEGDTTAGKIRARLSTGDGTATGA